MTRARRPRRPSPVIIQARFRGTCACCSGPVVPGETIVWRRGEQPRHLECPDLAPALEASLVASDDDRPTVITPAPCVQVGP